MFSTGRIPKSNDDNDDYYDDGDDNYDDVDDKYNDDDDDDDSSGWLSSVNPPKRR